MSRALLRAPEQLPATRPRRRRLPRVLLSLWILAAGAIGLELLMRWRAHLENREVLETALRELAPPTDDPAAGMANIIRLSADEHIVYELQPNLHERTFRGTLVTTNERGFRGPPIEPATPRTVTLVGLGDSIQFGHGLEDEETYLRLLEGLLQRRYPSVHWRVVNTAVPGYNTVMEVATLRKKVLDLDPDLVVLHICDNDFAPPQFVRNEENVFGLDRSFLADALRGAFAPAPEPRNPRATDGGSRAIRSGGEWWEKDEAGRSRVPEKYRHLFGREAFGKALDELIAHSTEHGFDLLMFTTFEYKNLDEMLRAGRERGMLTISMMDEVDAWLLEHVGQTFNEDSYRHSALVIGTWNSHPSALQHRMAADRLLRELEERGILRGILERRGLGDALASKGR